MDFEITEIDCNCCSIHVSAQPLPTTFGTSEICLNPHEFLIADRSKSVVLVTFVSYMALELIATGLVTCFVLFLVVLLQLVSNVCVWCVIKSLRNRKLLTLRFFNLRHVYHLSGFLHPSFWCQ